MILRAGPKSEGAKDVENSNQSDWHSFKVSRWNNKTRTFFEKFPNFATTSY